MWAEFIIDIMCGPTSKVMMGTHANSYCCTLSYATEILTGFL